VRIRVLSDLHLEFSPFEPPPAQADVVTLAGDIHLHTRGLVWARKTFPDTEVVYVAGNHEFYRSHWIGLLDQMRKKAVELDIHFLENSATVIGDTRFCGATLWTDFRLFGENTAAAERACEDALNDFHEIRTSRTGTDVLKVHGDWNVVSLPASLVRKRHLYSAERLQAELAKPFAGKTVVVTHHAPSMKSVAERYANDIVSSGFASNLDRLFGVPALWVHGHMHDSFDYITAGTRIVCNPRGYCAKDGGNCENRAFDPGLVIDI
jgi:hypothetical protein